jgi:hypothetical protein
MCCNLEETKKTILPNTRRLEIHSDVDEEFFFLGYDAVYIGM